MQRVPHHGKVLIVNSESRLARPGRCQRAQNKAGEDRKSSLHVPSETLEPRKSDEEFTTCGRNRFRFTNFW